jgi:hypothetical protein
MGNVLQSPSKWFLGAAKDLFPNTGADFVLVEIRPHGPLIGL